MDKKLIGTPVEAFAGALVPALKVGAVVSMVIVRLVTGVIVRSAPEVTMSPLPATPIVKALLLVIPAVSDFRTT